jgi:alpha-ketoglutarate-dependent taurine dioxygenase
MFFLQPESSGLHIHPITEAGSELGDQISVISSVKQKKGRAAVDPLTEPSKFASNAWHADITFERVPSDYAILKIHTLPATGGDTVSNQACPMKSLIHEISDQS